MKVKTKENVSCGLIGAGAIGTVFAAYLKRAEIDLYVVEYGEAKTEIVRTMLFMSL